VSTALRAADDDPDEHRWCEHSGSFASYTMNLATDAMVSCRTVFPSPMPLPAQFGTAQPRPF
jgi:hypothetical protein